MLRSVILFLAAVLSLAALPTATVESLPKARDSYGGWTAVRGDKTGFFHTQRINGFWWIITPEGNGFLSKGINSVRGPLKGPLPSETVPRVRANLVTWGMNTAGCWSDQAVEGEGISLAIRCRVSGAHEKSFPDVFDPSWRESVIKAALTECSPHRYDPKILGYFTDNELPWKHEDEARAFVGEFLKLPADAPGNSEAARACAGGEASIRAFRERVAEIYFKTTAEAIRAADPNHMILGCRFAGRPPLGVVARMAGYADIVSINNYSLHPPLALLHDMARAAGIPVLVSEFSFKGPAPGLATEGSGPVLTSQQERATAFTRYAGDLLKDPVCIGYHWFKYGDNWQGVLQADGTPWPELTAAFEDLSAKAEELHR
jgi:agarase